MSFMEGILEQNMPVWDKCIATMFVQDMKDGKLTIEDFKEYMVQDKKCGSLSEADQKKLGSIFEKASYPELDFWNIEEEKGMKDKICYVVGAGENYGLDFQPTAEDFVIAVDAGLCYLERQGIRADLVIGDFDTLKYIPKHSNTIVLSVEKDDTDTLAAVREGIKAGYTSFHIYCGTGGRIDHTMANLQVLAYLSANNIRGFLFDNSTVITAITNNRLCFEKIPCGYISVFSCSTKAEGVTLCGLKYELNNAVLTNTFPIGVSNEFIDRESSISVSDGTLFIVFPKEAEERIIQ